MKKLRILCAAIIVFAGLIIIVYPWVKAWHFSEIQKQIMETWQEAVTSNELISSNDMDAVISVNEEAIVNEDDLWEENTNQQIDIDYAMNQMEGIITIDRIQLKSPVLTNATKYNLDIAICSVANTGEMGQVGNYVVAGHKSRIYGRHFNRLLEISIGDVVVVENAVSVFSYQVSEIFSVTPSETWVMEDDGDKKLITLITCDYRTDPASRLIVRGELIDVK